MNHFTRNTRETSISLCVVISFSARPSKKIRKIEPHIYDILSEKGDKSI